MDTKKQLNVMTDQFISCFKKGDGRLAGRIFFFIMTGFSVLWLYIFLALVLWETEVLQVTGRELHSFVCNENRSGIVRSAMLFVSYPVTFIRYCIVPFMFITIFIVNFFYNCFACVTSIGASGWSTLQIDN